MSKSNVIKFRKTRQLNEAESRAAARVLWLVHKIVLKKIVTWVKTKRPKKNELRAISLMMLEVDYRLERMVKAPPSDGSDLDDLIEVLTGLVEFLDV